MRPSKIARILAASALSAAAMLTGLATSAKAASETRFALCQQSCVFGETEGTITWFNRTARVDGYVYDYGADSTTVFFEAYSGTTKIDSTSRTADDRGAEGSLVRFSFVIGDDGVAGLDRIRITMCFNTVPRDCGHPTSFPRRR